MEGWAAWRPASWIQWRPCRSHAGAMASVIATECSSRASRMAGKLKSPISGSVTAAPLRSLVRMSHTLCASMAEWKRFTRTAGVCQGGSGARSYKQWRMTIPFPALTPTTQTICDFGELVPARSLTWMPSAAHSFKMRSHSGAKPKICLRCSTRTMQRMLEGSFAFDSSTSSSARLCRICCANSSSDQIISGKTSRKRLPCR
mmetsp:Transcript_42171/g.98445  ORF Transcript_42171/g.98445 Transcript_42171/m.98445 type:complete len:202 (+) Transcript_42171:582-1187(+)